MSIEVTLTWSRDSHVRSPGSIGRKIGHDPNLPTSMPEVGSGELGSESSHWCCLQALSGFGQTRGGTRASRCTNGRIPALSFSLYGKKGQTKGIPKGRSRPSTNFR